MKFFKKPIAVLLLYIVTVHFSTIKPLAATVSPTGYPAAAGAPEIIAPSALVMDASTGIVIYDKNMNDKKYPASITKIMTALLTLEYAGDNLSERITFSHNAVFSLPYGSSHIAMDEDETLSIEQALYALMLASANEVANALSEHISGSTEAFAVAMTERAKSLGALNTNFSNPHGLHEETHYTTAYDMALIMKEAIRNPKFVELISTPFYEIPYTEKNPDPKPMHNTNKLIQSTDKYYYENVVGSKTGFTNEAGQTLVTYGKKGELELISVVMQDDKPGLYTDTQALLEYGFDRFKQVTFFDSYSTSLPVTQTLEEEEKVLGQLPVKAEKSLSALLPDVVTRDKVEQLIELPKSLTAPVKYGDKVGKILLSYQGISLGEVTVFAQDTIEVVEEEPAQEESGSRFIGMLIDIGKAAITVVGILALVFVLVVIIVRSVYQANRRKKRRIKKIRPDDAVMRIYRYRDR